MRPAFTGRAFSVVGMSCKGRATAVFAAPTIALIINEWTLAMPDEPLDYDGEIWKPVDDPRFTEPLEASSYGRVRRLPRTYTVKGSLNRGDWSAFRPMRLAEVFFSNGYPMVNVMLNGIVQRTGIHILTCTAFHGARPSADHEVAHWDGIRMNGTPGNLRWATRPENCEDTARHGSHAKGEACGRDALTVKRVIYIRQRVAMGEQYGLAPKLSREWGVSRNAIRAVITGRTWKHVT